MESFFILLPSIQKEFPRQVVESTLRGVWEVLQARSGSHTVCILQYDRAMLARVNSVRHDMSCILTMFFLNSVCIIKPNVHTTRNDPHICPESAFFHNNFSGTACRPRAAGSTPPAHSGRSNLPCTRECWESWTWKTVIYGDRLEPVPVIKIHQNTIFDSAAVLFFVFLTGASGVGL